MIFPFALAGLALLVQLIFLVRDLSAGRRVAKGCNRTDDWTRLSQDGQERAPTGTPLGSWFRRLVSQRLEPGETIEGIARGFFVPPRRKDWGPHFGLSRHPLLVAVTPRRILLFELGYLTALSFCSIDYGEVRFLAAPQTGALGTSSNAWFGLTSGRQYQFAFLGPLFSAEGMREEQRLAAWLRSIASRYPASPVPDSLAA